MEFKDLTPELREKALACKTPEDVLALAKEEGYELSDEELDVVAGGWNPVNTVVDRVVPECPECSSREVSVFPMPAGGLKHCVCHHCGYQWNKPLYG